MFLLLGGVHTLILSDIVKALQMFLLWAGFIHLTCHIVKSVTDVSALGGVHTLDLYILLRNYRCFCFGWGSYT